MEIKSCQIVKKGHLYLKCLPFVNILKKEWKYVFFERKESMTKEMITTD